ncbi:MAG: D-arabinose 5-phosphate isomerase [candidate division Zixibacteria bacterium SM23_81]|nr:MAG: D-arabinose 5-phosphate isomerase [candidate division Zixibacteria bacterium SM23_81]
MKRDKIITSIEGARQVIREEAQAVARLVDRIGPEFERAVEIILNCQGRVVVTGMGKSGLIGRKIAATLTSTGTGAIFLHTAEGMHGDLGIVQRNDCIIAISKSGETDEFYLLLPVFKRLGVPIIAITGGVTSPLAQKSDVVLDVSVDQEACPNNLAPTCSTTASLVMGDALAVALLLKRGFSQDDFAFLHPGGNLGRKLILKVVDVMHTDSEVPMVSETANMKETILEMTSKRLGVTTVVDDGGRLTGIITDGDLRRLVERTDDRLFSLTAGDAMTHQPKTISGDALAAEALNVMEQHSITSLIITDGAKKPVGIVHLHDLLKSGIV